MTTYVWKFALTEFFSGAGWPDFAIFHQCGYFWKLSVIFRKFEVAKKMATIGATFWATFCLGIFYIFNQIRSFKLSSALDILAW